uniref:Uncharacterized protein n=1 Tax=Arundo donax TaxID=35708 RepID=A0A0A8ZRA9_ARUDO
MLISLHVFFSSSIPRRALSLG